MTRQSSKFAALIALFGLSAAAAGPAHSASFSLFQDAEALPASQAESLDPTERDAPIEFGAPQELRIETRSGAHSIQAEIARTPDQLSRGLMWREELAADAGMLFIYEPPRLASMWMRNTLIPLDIVYLDEAGAVGKIIMNAQPRSLRPLPSDFRVSAVLELAGGRALEMDLRPGDIVRHAHFANLEAEAAETAEPDSESGEAAPIASEDGE